MAMTESRLDILEMHMSNMGATMKYLETQIGQLENSLKDHNIVEKKNKGKEAEGSESKPMESMDEPKQKPMFKPKLPYPQRLKKKAWDEQFAKFLEIVRKHHINIPFTDSLLQMPNYGKFLKELMYKKWNLEEFDTEFRTCKVKSTTIALQLADRSLIYSRGIIEDVLVKMDKFIFHAVLDKEEDANMSLNLGRPFFDTAEAKIVKKGKMSIGVEGEKATFTFLKEAKNQVFMIDHEKMMKSCCKVVSAVEFPK
ncbi:uncharacterized protein [Henckelia pumila]|uniref:uncharacterized protein n=1 Tax=Henckelia pumila TaxID=405737 RepID=UPI003C6DFEE3